jgi:hypothetical protein
MEESKMEESKRTLFPTTIEKPLQNASYYQEEVRHITIGKQKETLVNVTFYTSQGDKIITYDPSNDIDYRTKLFKLIQPNNPPKPVKATCTADGDFILFDKNGNRLAPIIKEIPTNILSNWKTTELYQDYDFSQLKEVTLMCYMLGKLGKKFKLIKISTDTK